MGEKDKTDTIMVLKVDLQCHKCYKKVKKVLCKFPQIRDQIYDEKQNQVLIKVVCCSPEKIRDKICCKGGSAIKSIEIKVPEKPKQPPANKPKDDGKPKGDGKPKDDGKPKGDGKPKDDPPNPGPPQPQPVPWVLRYPPPIRTCCKDCHRGRGGGPCHTSPVRTCCMDCYVGRGGGPCHTPPVRTCCMDCYQGRGGGPCHRGYGGGPTPYIQYDGYCGRPVYDSYGGGSRGYCEENSSACTVM